MSANIFLIRFIRGIRWHNETGIFWQDSL